MERRKRSIDMLSGLPDEVLCHILSFLPTWGSVRTSVLAKRWRFMWAHVPKLEFYIDNLDIINRVIMLHEAKILNTFSLDLSYAKGCAYQLETLIIYPIKRSVRNLYLDFDYDEDDNDIMCTLPRFLFTCKTLVDLKLVNCGVIPSSGELFLPSLEKLDLSYIEYENDKSLPHLLSGCPGLEELIIRDCFRKGQKNLGCVIVSSPTIKTLIVDFTKGREEYTDEMLIIDVPALVDLTVYDCDLKYVRSLRETMNSLIEAELMLIGEWHICGIDCTEHCLSIAFLSCLCHASNLKIACRMCDTCDPLVDIVRTGSMPKFVYLTKLEIQWTVNWHYLVRFLEVADNLRVLTISASEPYPYKKPKRVPPCMLSRLRTVKMDFSDSDVDFDVVRYILRNARVLKRMEIDPGYGTSAEEKLDALHRISLFERVSKSCQVDFKTRL